MQWPEWFDRWWQQVTDDLQNRYWPGVDDLMNWMDSHPDALLFLGVLLGVGFIVLFVGWWVGVMYVPPRARQTPPSMPQGLIPVEPGVHPFQDSPQTRLGESKLRDPSTLSVTAIETGMEQGPSVSPVARTARPSAHQEHKASAQSTTESLHSLESPSRPEPLSRAEPVSQLGPLEPLSQSQPPSRPEPLSRAEPVSQLGPLEPLSQSQPPSRPEPLSPLESVSHLEPASRAGFQEPSSRPEPLSRLEPTDWLPSPEPTLESLEDGHASDSLARDLFQEPVVPTAQQDEAESQWMLGDLGELTEMIEQASFDARPTHPDSHTTPVQEERVDPVWAPDHEPLVTDAISHEAAEEGLPRQSRPWRLSDINDLKALDARLGRAHGPTAGPMNASAKQQDVAFTPQAIQEERLPVAEVAEMAVPEPLFPKRDSQPARPSRVQEPQNPPSPPIPSSQPANLSKAEEPENFPDAPVLTGEEEQLHGAEGMTEPSRFADFQLKLDVSAKDLAEVGLPLQDEALLAESAVPAVPHIQSLKDLNSEQLLLVARYCQWRGDPDGVREALAPILERDDIELRRQALTLLEEC